MENGNAFLLAEAPNGYQEVGSSREDQDAQTHFIEEGSQGQAVVLTSEGVTDTTLLESAAPEADVHTGARRALGRAATMAGRVRITTFNSVVA